jgi:tetratricopeptide (TPR) repeat protein
MPIRRASGARSRSLLTLTVALMLARPGAAGAGAPEATRPSENPVTALAAIELGRLDATRGKAEAIAPLLALIDLADLLAPGTLDAPVRELAEAAGTDALVAAHAREWLARRADADGDTTAATSHRGRLGSLTRLWVVGPFGDGRSSYGTVYPPEQPSGAPALDQVFPGKERPVSWRRAENAERAGALGLEALLRPVSQATAYLWAWVRVEVATTAALRLGAPGPVKVWCNEQRVYAADRMRPSRFDQDAIGMRLQAGWNRLLIKTVVGDSSWRVFARLTTLTGAPLRFENDWAPSPAKPLLPSAAPAPPRADSRPPPRARSLQDALLARTGSTSGPRDARARAWLDLGRYLQSVSPGDVDRKDAAHAYQHAAALQLSVEAMLGLARVGRDEDESRRSLERALSAARSSAERARILSALGDIARDQRRDAAALARWQGALGEDPQWWPATLSIAGEERNAGLESAALARISALPAEVRQIPTVAREWTRSLMALDRRAAAEAQWRVLLTHAHDDAELSRELAAMTRARGEGRESTRWLEAAARLRPDIPTYTLDWARACEGAGDSARAVAILEAAARQLPDEPVFATDLGKLLDRLGRRAEAQRWLAIAVNLRPQDVELRRYQDGLVARQLVASGQARGARDDLPRRFAVPARQVLDDERQRGRPAGDGPGGAADRDAAIVLLDSRVVRVHDNGLSEVYAQRMVQVQTDSGAEDNKEFLVRYTPGSEEVEILEARIYRPTDAPRGWDVIQISERDDQDLSEPWYGLYYDYRAEVVRFEGLRAGDVLEVQYLVSAVSRENQLAGYFGDLQFVAEAVPKRRWDYTLLGPPGRTFHVAPPLMAGLVQTSTQALGEQVLQFSAREVPRIEIEPAMPGLAEISPFLHISTYGRVEEIGSWYWRLVAEQMASDDTIRAAALTAVPARLRAGMSDLDKVRAIHAFVLSQTRYVGLEFGIHGFKPYKVSQVLARKFGDCKDKAALMVALLAEVGIDADMVLLRTRRGGRLPTEPPSLAGFDHAIAYVPKLDLFLDGTAEFSGVDELPSQDQGVTVLRVSGRGVRWVQTPVLPSSRNRATRRWAVALDAQGGAEVKEELSVTGQAAAEWRQHYQTVGEQAERYGKVWSGRHAGARLLSVRMPGLEDRNRPVTVLARAQLPRLAEGLPGGALSLAMAVREGDLVRSYARLSTRRSALLLAYPWQHDERIDYQIPPGFEVGPLPEARHIETPFGRFDLTVERGARSGVTIKSHLDVSRERISASEYADFRRFLSDVDSVMKAHVVLSPVRPPERTAIRGVRDGR